MEFAFLSILDKLTLNLDTAEAGNPSTKLAFAATIGSGTADAGAADDAAADEDAADEEEEVATCERRVRRSRASRRAARV